MKDTNDRQGNEQAKMPEQNLAYVAPSQYDPDRIPAWKRVQQDHRDNATSQREKDNTPAYIRCLADLRYSSKDRERYEVKPSDFLQKLGDAFFEGQTQVFAGRPGNTPELRMEAMCRIGQYMEGISSSYNHRSPDAPEFSFSSEGNTQCPEPGKLAYYCHYVYGGTCYDGGCYSAEDDSHFYYRLSKVSDKEYDFARRFAPPVDSSREGTYRFVIYRGPVPCEKETEVVFVAKNGGYLYLKNPVGIAGCFLLDMEIKYTPGIDPWTGE